jgi:uncharacterized membrane protein
MLEPLKQIMVEYKTLIMKMAQENMSIVQARLNLDLICDIHTLLALFCLLPLLEVVNYLIKFAKGRDVFICDFVIIVEICQVYFFMMYFDPMITY